MYARQVESLTRKALRDYRCLSFVGPRQSGKTTLSKKIGKNFEYLSLENPDTRSRALDDPRSFLKSISSAAILDEVQRAPNLISYLQEILDDSSDSRQFILTGSNNLLLSEKISQSLAGRTRIFHILPFSYSELLSKNDPDRNSLLFTGSYPPIYDRKLKPHEWLSDYYQTYIEKDVRQLIQIGNLDQFSRFVRLCAGRVGQLLSVSSLANDAGVSSPTAEAWLSVLQASYICFRLQPHFKNFNKRLIKSPKLYFYDTGLLCFLLRVSKSEELEFHPNLGAIFENWVVLEHLKSFYNKGELPPLYFWRDQHGHEIDLIIDQGKFLQPCEIKAGRTFQDDYLKNLEWFKKLQPKAPAKCIYGGNDDFEHRGVAIQSWKSLSRNS